MGMRLEYVSIPESMIDRLRSEPALAGEALMAAEFAAMPAELLKAMESMQKSMAAQFPGAHQMLAQLTQGGGGGGAGSSSAGGSSGASLRSGAVRGSLEKAWHALHFVFTGKLDEAPAPTGFLLSGGEEVGEDMGYGPARVLRHAEVTALRDALHAISDAEFDRRFDVKTLAKNEVYPFCWDEDRDELLEEHMMHFEQLKNDLDQIVAAGEGMLIGLG